MKKWIIASTIILFISTACNKGESPSASAEKAVPAETSAQEKIGALAAQIAANLEDAKSFISRGEISQGLSRLLDVVLLTRPDEALPSGYKERIESARESFDRQDLAAGGDDVAAALALWRVDSGLPAPPQSDGADTGTPGPLAEIFATMLDESKALFEQGQADQGVAKILEALLLLAPRGR